MMKDELSGTIASESVGLRSKVVAYFKKRWWWNQAKKKLNSMKTNIVKDKVTLQNYEDVLSGKVKSLSETQNTLRANKHRMFIEKQDKKDKDLHNTKKRFWKIK